MTNLHGHPVDQNNSKQPPTSDSDRCERCAADIQALEQIDDDTDAVGVKFVKTNDVGFAKEVGVKEFPTIVYFEKGSPSIYEGK